VANPGQPTHIVVWEEGECPLSVFYVTLRQGRREAKTACLNSELRWSN